MSKAFDLPENLVVFGVLRLEFHHVGVVAGNGTNMLRAIFP